MPSRSALAKCPPTIRQSPIELRIMQFMQYLDRFSAVLFPSLSLSECKKRTRALLGYNNEHQAKFQHQAKDRHYLLLFRYLFRTHPLV